MDRVSSSLIEIGESAIWSVSSCKPGYGVANLRDNSIETYWQSDGTQPHNINIEFLRKTSVHSIHLYSDYRQDESYTPSSIVVKAGSHFHDLIPVKSHEMEEPTGWIEIDLFNSNNLNSNSNNIKETKAFVFQISILANHLNGRDTHVRQIKVFATKQIKSSMTDYQMFTADYKAFETIR